MPIVYDSTTAATLAASQHTQGVDPSGGFAYKLDLHRPFVVTAIHAGHTVRSELLPLMALSERGRLAEEDAATDRIIQDCPSTLWGLDSRTEYDLNRPPESALPLTPERFWGTAVFASSPTDAMIRRSLEKYDAFYRFFGAVIQVLLNRFGACVIYDIHAYNIQRQLENGHSSPPVFNVGTRGIDRIRWKKPIHQWLDHLGRIALPEGSVSVAENQVFNGKGEFCRRLSRWDPNILVLPTEISKIYMNERDGTINPVWTQALATGLAKAVDAHATAFQSDLCR